MLQEPGDHRVDAPIMCSITRFGLRHRRGMLPSYLDYRRIDRASRDSSVSGLLRSAFLIENPTTWFSLSVWLGEPVFSAQVPNHIDAARRVFGRLSFEADRGPELWSTRWRLVSVSNNLNWEDFDLGQTIEDRASWPTEA